MAVEDAPSASPPPTEVEAEDTGAELMERPFNPAEIRIDYKPLTVDLLAKRLGAEGIDLAPAFQRQAGLWRGKAQSRLIESMMIRIPIPAFYLDATNDERWLVVDGLQRLTAISRFMVKKELKLQELEFLDLNGKGWDDLPRPLQRRIEETQVVTYLIQPGTPPEVKFNIFKRINTGGLPLSPQEIRHAINQGPAATLLAELADSDEFKEATAGGIRDERMTDRECVLRFFAFTMSPPDEYKSQDLDTFLNNQMRALNQMSPERRTQLTSSFRTGMTRAVEVFGNDAFRKRYSADAGRKPINKALFETWSVNLAALDGRKARLLVERADSIRMGFIHLMGDREFERSVTAGTGDARTVIERFLRVKKLLNGVLS